MGYAVELYFDKSSEEIIKFMWKILYDKDISKYMHESDSKPHITLAVYEDGLGNFNSFADRIKSFTGEVKPFKLNLSNIGVFPGEEGVVFLGVKITQELLKLHDRFHEVMGDYSQFEWPLYQPAAWIPHCTMGINLSKKKLLEAVEIIYDLFKPMVVTVDRISIVKFRPVEHMAIYDL